MDGYSHICVECKRYRKCRECEGRWLCEECHPAACTRPDIHTEQEGRTRMERCIECRHCIVVYDEFYMQAKRWVCLIRKQMMAQYARPNCNDFEPKVPQTPYIGKIEYTRLGKPLGLFTQEDLLAEIRGALIHVENLLKALELQPRVEHPHDPGGELARGQRRG